MDAEGRSRPAAGEPPWLLIALILLIFEIPRIFGTLKSDLADFQTLEETQRTQIAVEEIEDVSSLFPVETPQSPPRGAPPAQQQAWFKELKRLDDRRNAEIHNWLLGGVCARFRSEVREALSEIEAVHQVDDSMKVLLRKLVQLKTESLANTLRHLGNNDLRELVRREGWEPPPTASQFEMVTYLVDPDEQQRSALRSKWRETEQPGRGAMGNSNPAGDTIEILSMKGDWLLLYLGYLVDLGILSIPVAGLFTVALPHWRGWLVERQFRLEDIGEEFAELKEMRDFVANRAPLVELRANLLHPGHAFVYPKGYRKPRLAVLNGMYRLWRSDPEAARGTLLHEIEHIRQGDHLIVGYGSFFSHYLMWILALFAAVILAGLLLALISSVAGIGLNLEHQAKLAGRWIGMALAAGASTVFLMMSFIVIALAGIWGLELNADYGASRGARLEVRCGTRLVGQRWVSRALGGLTHPPLWFRAWLIEKDDLARGLCRQVLFPSSYLIKLVFLFLFALCAELTSQHFSMQTVTWILGLARGAFASEYWIFGGSAALILLWPRLAHYWERFFIGQGREYALWDNGRSAAALLLGTLAIVAWWARP